MTMMTINKKFAKGISTATIVLLSATSQPLVEGRVLRGGNRLSSNPVDDQQLVHSRELVLDSVTPVVLAVPFDNNITQLIEAADEYMEAVATRKDPRTTQACKTFGYPMDTWDVSQVSSFRKLFSGHRNPIMTQFNEEIGSWDVSSATDMYEMFYGAVLFNQDISGWDVSSVETFSSTFSGATAFNSDLSGWTVTDKCLDMYGMFANAVNFDQDVGKKWDTSSVQKMRYMFAGATSFNHDVSNFDISSVHEMDLMFGGASKFNQNLCRWAGEVQDPKNGPSTTAMFLLTSCPESEKIPSSSNGYSGPWCHSCPN